jgi:GAF domain-containing protein
VHDIPDGWSGEVAEWEDWGDLEARTRELSEAREQQAATAEVLQVISSSPGELEPVFEAMLANATRLCDAKFASLLLSEGDQLRRVSVHNAPAALVEHMKRTPLVRPNPESALGRAALTKQVAQIDDYRTSPAYLARDPLVVAGFELGGYRAALAVPMLKDGMLVGVIVIYRQEVGPFTDRPSSPSRTRGCSTSCGSAPTICRSHFSSRLPPPTC